MAISLSLQTSKPSVFCCPEESNFYSACIENFVFKQSLDSTATILEFGSGHGFPVIDALKRTAFPGKVYGFETDEVAAKTAQKNIWESYLTQQYIIEPRSFFSAPRPKGEYLISNPPYIPALDDNIYNPLLYGGVDGSQITKDLFSLHYPQVMVMVSSYSNPVGIIDYALNQGYWVENFLATPLSFGEYSSELKVKRHIYKMKAEKLAFCSENIYLLAGALFKKKDIATANLAKGLQEVLTSL